MLPMANPTMTVAATGDDELTLAGLEAVVALLPGLERVEREPAQERGGELAADGSIQMPYLQHAPEVEQLLRTLAQRQLPLTFDWTSWQDQAQRFRDPSVVTTASLDELRRLLTVHLRKERFCEGHLAEVIRSGHLTAIFRRLAAITAELRASAGRTRLRVERGDITRIAADAIVNAANSALSGGGGVDGAIHRAAGPDLLAACRGLGRCPTGAARLTAAFQLPARWVIHAVGPVWQGGNAGEPAQLASAYRASLVLALDTGCRSVAFPAISCGAYQFPIATAAQIAVATIRSWCDLHPGIDDVILVAFEPEVATALQRALST
jgi:O-acetyl-ADP-ribose deacetylase